MGNIMSNIVFTNILTFLGTSILWSLNMWWTLKKQRAEAAKAVLELNELKQKLSQRDDKIHTITMIRRYQETREPHIKTYTNPKQLSEAFKAVYGKEIKEDSMSQIYTDLKSDGMIKQDGFGKDYF
jgi:hypothetical protein